MRAALIVVAGLMAGLASLPGCCRLRAEDVVDGVIEAEVPLRTPIEGQPACAVRVNLNYLTNTGVSGSSSRSYSERSELRYAPGATFVVGGKRLLVVGSGGSPSFLSLRTGGSWGSGSGPAPEGLRGWGAEHDRLLAAAMAPSLPSPITRITFSDEYLPCGTKVGLRGQVHGDRIVLRPQKLRPGGATKR